MSNVQVQHEAMESSSSQIVKSTAIIGLSNVLSTAIRIARMKVFALFLGPAGIGLFGLYNSIMTTTAAVSGMGVGSSGVRQIAQANGNQRTMARALATLRWVTLVLGIAGGLGLVLLSRVISRWTFGNSLYAVPLALLSLGVLCQIVSDSQNAILNGLRRVRDLALVNIIGTLLGTIAAIVLVWKKGAVTLPWLVVLPVMATLACSWWARRRIPIVRERLSGQELKTEAFSLLSLGAAFMLAGLMMTGALLFTRVIFVARLGLSASGYFQAAWAIAVINVDFILNAMGIDFYPHLTACIRDDRPKGNRLVNEQTQVALLLGGPVILGMLTAAPLLIRLFYSAQFYLATDLLRWLLFGSILKIVSWPMGYLIMAHGWARASLFAEFAWCSSYVGFLYWGCSRYGINSAGYAFVFAYLVYAFTAYVIGHQSGEFRWTQSNILHASGLLGAALFTLAIASVNVKVSYAAGSIFTMTVMVMSLKKLGTMIDHPIARRISRLLNFRTPRLQPRVDSV